MIKRLLLKYKRFIYYVVFGVLTTLINIGVYALAYKTMQLDNVPSNIIAWIVAILFAFVVDKLYVFEARNMELKNVLYELVKFIGARLTTGLFDLAIMFVGVDVLHGPAIIIKVAANIMVIILNYVLSKLVVFRKK